MGFDPLTLFLASTALQVGSGIMQYSQQKKADRQASEAAAAQSALIVNDAQSQADQEIKAADQTRRVQLMQYLKSGVTLEGSPLLVMNDTTAKGAQNAKNVMDSAKAKAGLVTAQGNIKRANLVGTALDTASGVAGSYTNYEILNNQIKTNNELLNKQIK